MCSHVETYSQCRILFCYTGGLLCAGRDIPVSRNSLTRYTAWHLRIRRLVQFIFVGAVYHNALTNCAALLCRACVDLTVCVAVGYLTLRTGFERHGRKNPLSYSYFRSCRRSLVCVRLSNKGKVGVQRGRETAGVSSFLSPPRVRRRPRRGRGSLPRSAERSSFAEVQRKTLRPVGRTACAVRAPRSIGAEKGCRPEWSNRLRGSCAP